MFWGAGGQMPDDSNRLTIRNFLERAKSGAWCRWLQSHALLDVTMRAPAVLTSHNKR
jgi:hypothetical protein